MSATLERYSRRHSARSNIWHSYDLLMELLVTEKSGKCVDNSDDSEATNCVQLDIRRFSAGRQCWPYDKTRVGYFTTHSFTHPSPFEPRVWWICQYFRMICFKSCIRASDIWDEAEKTHMLFDSSSLWIFERCVVEFLIVWYKRKYSESIRQQWQQQLCNATEYFV